MWLLWACAEPSVLPGDGVYVWNGAWSPEVSEAVEAARAQGLRIHALRAEVGTSVRAVAAEGPHVAVVRVTRFDAGTLDSARSILADLDAEPDVLELELDVDTPTARLDDYAAWLATLDPVHPLGITALPDWLSSPDLPSVLDAVDGWTLQVHAPTGTILDAAALRAVTRAEALGRPFRVALPAYGVGVARDGEGVAVGVVGEDVRFSGDEAWADPGAVAEVVRALDGRHALTWFRLPVAGDRWTWSDATWSAVRAGQAPAPAFVPIREGADLRLRNDGEGDAAAPAVHLRGRVDAWDAVAGWTAAVEPEGVRFLPPASPIRARSTVPIGWARGEFTVTQETR